MNDDTGHVTKVAIELSGKRASSPLHKNACMFTKLFRKKLFASFTFDKQFDLHSSNSLMTRVTIKIVNYVLHNFSVPSQNV